MHICLFFLTQLLPKVDISQTLYLRAVGVFVVAVYVFTTVASISSWWRAPNAMLVDMVELCARVVF